MRPSRWTTLIALFLGTACPLALAQNTQPASKALRFEKGEPVRLFETEIPKTVVWSSTLRINRSALIAYFDDAGMIQGEILERADELGLSAPQCQLMKDELVIGIGFRNEPPPGNASGGPAPGAMPANEPAPAASTQPNGPAGTIECGLFAVSEADARRLAGALVDYYDAANRTGYEDCRKQVATTEEIIAKLPAKIEQDQKESDALPGMIEQLEKIVPVKGLTEASKDQIELQKLLRSINIDIEGIQAKLAAIGKQWERTDIDRRQYLDQLRVPQDIELAGALARKRSTEAHLKNTTDYVRALARQAELPANIKSEKNRLATAKQSLPDEQKMVEDVRAIMARALLTGPVVLRPVEVQPMPKTPPQLPAYQGPPLPPRSMPAGPLRPGGSMYPGMGGPGRGNPRFGPGGRPMMGPGQRR